MHVDSLLNLQFFGDVLQTQGFTVMRVCEVSLPPTL